MRKSRVPRTAALLIALASPAASRPAVALPDLGQPAGALPAPGAADRVVLPGSVHPLARPELAVGRTDPRLPMERIVVALELRPGARARLAALVAEQQDPASPRYHGWLTPADFGAELGLGDADLGRVTSWLEAQGLTVGHVAAGRGWIEVSGTAGQVERAFATEMRDYRVAGEIHHANALPPSVPRSLAGLVKGIVSLHDFPLTSPLARRRARQETAASGAAAPAPQDNGAGGVHLLAPADLATIYHLQPLYAAGIDGGGQSIAVVGKTDIKLADVQTFRSTFGLPPNDPVFVHNGPDPGITDIYNEGESDLDVEWAGALSRRATVQLVISASTATTDGIMLSAQYAVDQNLAPVVSVSYGQCELHLGSQAMTFWNDLWTQAAAQGITAVVAAGDSGPAICDPPNTTRASIASPNGLCSTPFDVCVGGSEFDDTANPGQWWAAANDPVTKSSALSYIPEVAWNESGAVPGGSGLWASGGGASSYFTKPAWQSAPGVPDDGRRDVPDVALAAANHTAYIYVEDQQEHTIGGTSGAAPSFAGMMALLAQRAHRRQGNINPALYMLGSGQYSGTGPAIFHDVTSGNNSVPGVGGYGAGPGYDQVTGLGTVDGAALVGGWPDVAAGCTAGPTTLCIDDTPGDGRFAISSSFVAGSQPAAATAVSLASVGVAHGGLFWFFAASNPEVLIKVLDGCGVNQQFWIFFAATTNVYFTVTVTDTTTGHSKQYTNPANTAALPVQDTAAFPCR
ncbi:MAG: S8/S53 family peptidase [Acidobacteria bacterium]|nr:S8/S53 family peptidase [Acidobacteriota bacterium]